MIATIDIEFDSEIDAKQVLNSINPDNTPLPVGISIDTDQTGTRVKLRIECSRGIDSLRSTVEDIMSAIDLSVRTIDTIE
jgi:tRNA threonylcarbamoyladenosine modification (KEOPS) complex  Pcc1 subunit